MKPIKEPKINITKQGIVKFSRVTTIIIIFLLYVMADFIKEVVNDTHLITSFTYWATTIVNVVLVACTMLVVRAIRKDKKISECTEITDTMKVIQRGFNKITIKGLSTDLDEFLVKLNEQNKYETFIKQVRERLMKIADKEKEKYEVERKKLNELLSKPKEEIVKMNIKYKKITVSKLFSSLDGKIVNDNEYDLDTYETRDVLKMVGLKTLLIVLFSAFSGMIVVDFFISGWSVIYSTLIKLFSLFMAINTAMNTADDFVEHNIRISVQRRLKYLAEFVNSKPDLKEILSEKKGEEK